MRGGQRSMAIALLVGCLIGCPTISQAALVDVASRSWNLLPTAVRIVNDALHVVCGVVHNAVHTVAGWLEVSAP